MNAFGPKDPRKQAGMTLIEILIVMLLVAIVMGVVVVNIGGIFTARLSKATGKLSAMTRYTYNQATLKGEIYRLAINIDSGTYVIEEVEEPQRCPDLGEGFRQAKRDDGKDQDDESFKWVGKEFTDMRVRKEKLPDSLNFSGVMKVGDKEPVTEGEVYIYFFPDGTAEKAFIWLTDGEDVWTVEIRRLLGTGRVYKEELEARDFTKR